VTKHPKRPRDPAQLAKLIVDIATGEVDETVADSTKSGDDKALAALGRIGGLKGGRARAEKLTPEQRREIAQRAAAARWKNDR
jgi:hypothetical protein